MTSQARGESDQDYNVFRTNRSKLIVRFRSVVMTKYAHPPFVSAGFNLVGSCDVSCFNSLTRRQFVSGSYVGCMSTANYTSFVPWYLRLIIRTISNRRQLSRERAPTSMSRYQLISLFPTTCDSRRIPRPKP